MARIASSNKSNDVKRKRFVRIAERRVNRIILDLEHLSKCSNKKNYSYANADIQKIFKEIDKKLRLTKRAFEDVHGERSKFKLD